MASIRRQLPLDDIATSPRTGTIGEPTFAVSGRTSVVAGNWYAARSTDSGGTWAFVDPFVEHASPRAQVCCDQVVLRTGRWWVWYLQYEASRGQNFVRVALSRTAAPGSWRAVDLAPTDLEPGWTGLWFDYPDLAVSKGHLWLTSNLYDASDRWKRAVVVRWPLTELGAAGAIPREHWSTIGAGSLKLVAGAGDAMWFVSSDRPRRRVRLFRWPDAGTAVTTWDIPVTPWDDADYTSVLPGGGRWLTRADDRVTAAWRARGRLGVHWTAGRMPGRPHPHVRSVVLDEASLSVVSEPDLWSGTAAWAYPGTAVDRFGRVGVAAYTAGPTQPALAVGLLDPSAAAPWDMTVAATSTDAPASGTWGDYLTVRPRPRGGFVAAGCTMQGGSDRKAVEPRLVEFSTS
jgi:hypothetical protein